MKNQDEKYSTWRGMKLGVQHSPNRNGWRNGKMIWPSNYNQNIKWTPFPRKWEALHWTIKSVMHGMKFGSTFSKIWPRVPSTIIQNFLSLIGIQHQKKSVASGPRLLLWTNNYKTKSLSPFSFSLNHVKIPSNNPFCIWKRCQPWPNNGIFNTRIWSINRAKTYQSLLNQ